MSKMHLSVLLSLTVAPAFASAGEPQGIDKSTKESRIDGLTPAEEKLIRQAVYRNGPSVGTDYRNFSGEPPRRVLAIPDEIASVYRTKSLVTLRLLLRIAEGGRPFDARHAICLIGGLVEGPVYGGIMAIGIRSLELDDAIEGKDQTYRQRLCTGCESLIRDAEKRLADKKNKQ